MVTAYTPHEAPNPEEAQQRWQEYQARVRLMDFRGCPDLPRYFLLDFFNDGHFERFDYDLARNTLVLQLESVPSLNDVYNTRAQLGLPRAMPHRCEDFSYLCTFQDVVYLQIRRHTMRVEDGRTGAIRHELAGLGPDDYQHGELLESDLVKELAAETGHRYFHLRIETGWAREINLIFRKVLVRKLNDVKPESYTGGKRVRLTRLYRG